MAVIVVGNPTESQSSNDGEAIDDEAGDGNSNLNENESQSDALYELLERYFLLISIGGSALLCCVIACIFRMKRRRNKKYKIAESNMKQMKIEISPIMQIPTNRNGETQTLQRIQSISSVDCEDVFMCSQSNKIETATSPGPEKLIDILREIGLYDSLYVILKRNGLDYTMLENNLKDDEVEQLAEEMELSTLQKMQFRKLMNAITNRKTFKQNDMEQTDAGCHADSSDSSEGCRL